MKFQSLSDATRGYLRYLETHWDGNADGLRPAYYRDGSSIVVAVLSARTGQVLDYV